MNNLSERNFSAGLKILCDFHHFDLCKLA